MDQYLFLNRAGSFIELQPARICQPSLVRLAEKTGDTVFLTIRSGYDTVCIDRREGSFPIRTLTLDVGTRRPLGVGAGGLALLMSLPDQSAEEVISANALRLVTYKNSPLRLSLSAVSGCSQVSHFIAVFG